MSLNTRKICAECKHWTCGEFWGSGSGKHGVVVESKGWCTLKSNKRKRWNYIPACKDFLKAKRNGFFYEGGNLPIEEDLANITELMKELVEDNTKES